MEKQHLENLKKCSRCGGCQAHCPLYTETGREQFVARGKIELLEHLVERDLQWNDKLAQIFSTCLLCGSCHENCPNGVKADKLVLASRKELVADRGLPILKKNVFQHLLKYNGRLNALGKVIYLYQNLGVQKLVRRSRLLKLLPGDIAGMEALLPPVASGPFRKTVPQLIKIDRPRLKIAYFTGCITNLINHHVGHSILKIMKAYNVEVVIPDQVCCGVPAFASGDFETGRFLGEKNLDEFAKYHVDYIITDCASCLSTWLEYPELLESDIAKVLAAKVMDINRFLVEVLDIKPVLPPVPKNPGLKVTYHDPCHLKRTPGGKSAPRELLKRLSPVYEFVEMGLADRCCGSAGSFNLSHYRLSQAVAAHKVKSILETKAGFVASSCPSCLMQLDHACGRTWQGDVSSATKESAKESVNLIKAKHVVELVAECLENKGSGE